MTFQLKVMVESSISQEWDETLNLNWKSSMLRTELFSAADTGVMVEIMNNSFFPESW